MALWGPAWHLGAPILGLAVNVLAQVLSFRRKSRLSLLQTIFFGFFAGLATMMVIDLVTLRYTKSSLDYYFGIILTNLITYGSLGYCYFHFVNLGETSRRIRLLRELYDAEGGLTTGELLRLYNAKNVIPYRIQRLLNNNQIVVHNDRYRLANPSVLWISNLIICLKLLILGKQSEFD